MATDTTIYDNDRMRVSGSLRIVHKPLFVREQSLLLPLVWFRRHRLRQQTVREQHAQARKDEPDEADGDEREGPDVQGQTAGTVGASIAAGQTIEADKQRE